MKRVFKYVIPISDRILIEMPKGAQILSFQIQGETPCVWVLVDPREPLEARSFRIAGTGHPIESHLSQTDFIGTAQMDGGALVWHLFEL